MAKTTNLSFTEFEEEKTTKGAPKFTKVTDGQGKKVETKKTEKKEAPPVVVKKIKKAKVKVKAPVTKSQPVKMPKPAAPASKPVKIVKGETLIPTKQGPLVKKDGQGIKPPSPSAYRTTNAASRRHRWEWVEGKVGSLAVCTHAGCTAKMNYIVGNRGGICRFYTVSGDKAQLQKIGPCPSLKVKS